MKITKSQAKQYLSKTFPEYSGRKFYVEFTDIIIFDNTNWSGGTKNEYAALGSNGKSSIFDAPAPWANPVEGVKLAMRPDVCIVEHSFFCGHDMGVTIYLHPCHAPKWLNQ